MALLICPECHEKPVSATLCKPCTPLYCPVCFADVDGLHVKLPCSHTLCIGHYKMMGGDIDETQEAKVLKDASAASKGATAGLSSQAKRHAARKEKKNGEKAAEPSPTSSSSSAKAKKTVDAGGETWFPTQKKDKEGRFLDSTTRLILFCMLVCGLSNSYFRSMGPDWLQDVVENAPQKLMNLPSVLQKSGLSMLADALTGESETAQPPVNFKTVADGDLSVAEGEAVHGYSTADAAFEMETVTAHELAED